MSIDRLTALLCLATAAAALNACSRAPAAAAEAQSSTSFRAYSLTVYGYNYTDTEIGSFEVNGRGGGNLEVSTPSGGGGGSTCCVSIYTPISSQTSVTIKWTRDGDTWCEQDVPLKGLVVPAKAEYFEVHFYRDGHIEVAVTQENSYPRLRLDREHANSRHADPTKNVDNDAVQSRCKRGYQ